MVAGRQLLTAATAAIAWYTTSPPCRITWAVILGQDAPWFGEAFAAFSRGAETGHDWRAIAPFFYGRWDAAAQSHWLAGETQTNEAAADGFDAEGAFDPAASRAGLATFGSPVLVSLNA